MSDFSDVIEQLCRIRNCSLLSHEGNIIAVKSDSGIFYSDLAYFKAACDCYIATTGSTAWIVGIDTEEDIIKLGYN